MHFIVAAISVPIGSLDKKKVLDRMKMIMMMDVMFIVVAMYICLKSLEKSDNIS